MEHLGYGTNIARRWVDAITTTNSGSYSYVQRSCTEDKNIEYEGPEGINCETEAGVVEIKRVAPCEAWP